MPTRVHQPSIGGLRRGLAGVVVSFVGVVSVVSLVGGCTRSTWDTSEIDNTSPTTTRRYGRDEAGVVASLTAGLSRPQRNLNRWSAPVDQATCAARRLTGRLGVARMLEIGYDPRRPTVALAYSAEERVAAVNILLGCIDFSRAILELLSSYQKLPLSQSNCLAEGFGRLGLVRDLAIGVVDGKEPDPLADGDRFARSLSGLVGGCLEEGDLSPAGPLAPTPAGEDLNTTTTTMRAPGAADGGLDGIVPGGPLDTTAK